MLIGSGGSGKSTLARRMGAILGLPVYHLDRLHWKPGWVSTPKEEWRGLQVRLCAEPTWIIDGNYGGTLDLRLAACDTVIFLDLSRWVCLWRALKRYFLHRGESRPDMTPGCPEKLDWDFFRWIWNYPTTKRPGVLKKLSEWKRGKATYIFQSPQEIEAFLRELKRKATQRAP